MKTSVTNGEQDSANDKAHSMSVRVL